MAGYEAYALDNTPNERQEAETLEDRVSLKAQKDDPVRYGHKYSWLVRLVKWGTSWVAPVDVQRVATCLSDSQVGAVQVKELALRNPIPKLVVEDSLHSRIINFYAMEKIELFYFLSYRYHSKTGVKSS